MAHVPGYEQDVFVSYAHWDDSEWVHTFVYKLKSELKSRGVEANIWIDRVDIGSSRDFRKEIPDAVKASATFVLFTSPLYIRSEYWSSSIPFAQRAAVSVRSSLELVTSCDDL